MNTQEIRVLSDVELDAVNGGPVPAIIAFAIGFVFGCGTGLAITTK